MNSKPAASGSVQLPVISAAESGLNSSPPQGLPDWPIEVRTAVEKRLTWLKSRLVDIVVRLLDTNQEDGEPVQPQPEQEFQFQRLLNLDEDYLRILESWDVKASWLRWLPRVYGSWAEAEIGELLTETQRQEFQQVGIGSLLSRIEYPWESEWPIRLKKLNIGFVLNTWNGDPEWPEELVSAVAERLFELKSQTLQVVAEIVLGGRSKPASSEAESQRELELTLSLDEAFLETQQDLYPDETRKFRRLRSDAVAEIESLLNEQQLREFRELGISSLLSRTEYPWEAVLMLKLNRLPVPHASALGQPKVDSALAEQESIECFTQAWDGLPEWSPELNQMVAKRLVLLKSQLLDIVVQFAHVAVTPGERGNESNLKPDGQNNIRQLLSLDEAYLRALESSNSQAAWLPRSFGAWTTSLIEELLSEEQRLEFRELGLSSMLSRIEYSWDTEFIRRLNRNSRSHNDEDIRGLFCPRPFEYVEIGAQGKTHLCCAVMLPTVAGDKQNGSFMDVWNSETAQSIRQSILDGTFSHCVEHLCPELQNRTLPKRDELTDPYHLDIIANHRTVLPKGPKRITMNYDKSCNLACPMCRTERITAKGAEKQAIEAIQEWATSDHLSDVREMVISTAGDAFGSGTYHTFLRTFDASPYPDLRLRLVTNGLHLTPKNWERICHENVDAIHISIDAATAETYRINRGADFEYLRKNLEFAGQLRSSGQLQSLIFNYTVQENNFAEMPAFVSMATEIHADLVIFIQLANGGTFSDEEYEQRAVHKPTHPRYGELLEVLKNPLLRMPMVQLQLFGTLS